MTIIVAGDYCLQGRLEKTTDNSIISTSLLKVIQGSDYSVVNLESPLSSIRERKPRPKQGPSLKSGKNAIDALDSIGFSCTTLANNHLMDYGSEALAETFSALSHKKIDFLGAGVNLNEASRILFKSFGNQIVAFINCCEHEFSVAERGKDGANPLNPIRQYYQIEEARNKADYVILIIHGGVEHFQYPTSRMVQTYRFFVDAGADAVINHHQHCPCGYEIYKGKPIYYGLGNFCFDWVGKRNSIWNLGYMVKLQFGDSHQIRSEIIPYIQCDEDPVVKPLTGEKLIQFNLMMDELCSAINSEPILDQKLCEFNKRNDYLYRKMLEPYNGRLANSLYRKGLLPTTISKERVLALMDFIVCESHYERVKEFLNRQYKRYFNE